MKITTLASGSSGNSYLLDDGEQVLVIECGVPLMEVKRAIKYQVIRLAGAIVSHEHGDHAGYVMQYQKMGLSVFRPYRTITDDFQKIKMGHYEVTSFPLVHDVPCFGFLIETKEKRILYSSDTVYIKYRFKDIDCMIVEANYDKSLLIAADDDSPKRSHVLHGHMDIDTTCRFIKANDNERLKAVILAHMSEVNGDKDLFIRKAQNVTDAKIAVADKGLEIII